MDGGDAAVIASLALAAQAGRTVAVLVGYLTRPGRGDRGPDISEEQP